MGGNHFDNYAWSQNHHLEGSKLITYLGEYHRQIYKMQDKHKRIVPIRVRQRILNKIKSNFDNL
jgi:hypothetical protein